MNFEVRYQCLPPYFKTEHSFPKLSGMLADDGLQRFAFWELSLGEKASHPHSCFILKSWLHSMAEQWRATKAHNFPLFGGKLYRDILAPGRFFLKIIEAFISSGLQFNLSLCSTLHSSYPVVFIVEIPTKSYFHTNLCLRVCFLGSWPNSGWQRWSKELDFKKGFGSGTPASRLP